MKISKIFAGMSALAIAAAMAVPAAAASGVFTETDDLLAVGRASSDTLFAVFISGDETEGNVISDVADAGQVYGASFTVKVDEEIWNTTGTGGSINFNATSCGWTQFEWAGGSWVSADDVKDATVYTTSEEGVYVIEYVSDAAVFASSDSDEEAYAAVGISHWGDVDMEITGVKILGEGSSVLYEAGANSDKVAAQEPIVADESSEAADSTADTSDTSSASSTDSSSSSSSSSTSSSSTSTSSTSTTTTTTTTTSTASTSSTASDNTNASTGATAGIALAGLALAGAAAVVSKRK